MSIIHEALKKASRKRGGLYQLIEHDPVEERLHIERPDRIKRYAIIIILSLVALNASIFAWNFSLKSEMRRIALQISPAGTAGENAKAEEFTARAPGSTAARDAPPGTAGDTARADNLQDEAPSSLEEQPPPELLLKGTMLSRRHSRAFINESMVKVGDTIEGAEVLSIQEDSVTLRKGDRKFDIYK